MCHRDLKLENLLLSDNPPKLKICDFGYSKSSKWQSQAKSKVSNPSTLRFPALAWLKTLQVVGQVMASNGAISSCL